MFTNEFEFDHTIITVIDDEGAVEDVQIMLDDDSVFIRQFTETTNQYEVIIMTPKMYYEIIQSFTQSEGLYKVEYGKE